MIIKGVLILSRVSMRLRSKIKGLRMGGTEESKEKNMTYC